MTLRPLLAYAPWQLREMGVRALAPLLMFAVLVALPLWATLGAGVSDAGAQTMKLRLFQSMAGLCVLIGGFLVTNSTISTDRERQHVRFLFAHPVSPVAFYLQRYVVGTLAVSSVFMVGPMVYSAAVIEVPVWGALQAILLGCLFYGALSLLAGAITAKDGAVVIAVFLVGSVTQQLTAADTAPQAVRLVATILPPVNDVGDHIRFLLGGRVGRNPMPLWGVGLWTAGMLAAALALVRRGPMVR